MKIVIENNLGEVSEIQISYIWDNRGDDKFLVVVDNKNKIKYCPDSYSLNFNENSIRNLIYKFAKVILGIEESNLRYSFTGKLKANNVCHADDFMNHYKKNYQYVGCNKCREIGLKY